MFEKPPPMFKLPTDKVPEIVLAISGKTITQLASDFMNEMKREYRRHSGPAENIRLEIELHRMPSKLQQMHSMYDLHEHETKTNQVFKEIKRMFLEFTKNNLTDEQAKGVWERHWERPTWEEIKS